MTGLDWLLLGVILASTVLALMRGMVSELLSLAGWVGAFYVAKEYAASVEPLLPQAIPTQDVRWLASFVVVMVVVWLLLAVFRLVASKLIHGIGLGGADRLLGSLFGVARGVLLATLIVMLGGLTHMPAEPFWRNAVLAAPFEQLAMSLKHWLPEAMAARINFQQEADGRPQLTLPLQGFIKA